MIYFDDEDEEVEYCNCGGELEDVLFGDEILTQCVDCGLIIGDNDVEI